MEDNEGREGRMKEGGRERMEDNEGREGRVKGRESGG